MNKRKQDSKALEKPLRGLSILVADDDPLNREMLVTMLGDLGALIAEAADGAEAVQAAQAKEFDLLLIDFRMPKLGGKRLVQGLLDSPSCQHGCPLVVMSAAGMDEGEMKLQELGVKAVLQKPIEPHQILTVLNVPFHEGNEAPEAAKHGPPISAGLDQERLLSLQSFHGRDGRFLDTLIAMFRKQAPAFIAEIGRSIEAGSMPNACERAHQLSGLCRNIGATHMAAVASALDARLGSNTESGSDPLVLLKQLDRLFAEASQELEKHWQSCDFRDMP